MRLMLGKELLIGRRSLSPFPPEEQEAAMTQAERFGVENHGRMLMELVENDPLFKDFSIVEIDAGLPNEWPAFVPVKKGRRRPGRPDARTRRAKRQ
jgi:hypothetical protein